MHNPSIERVSSCRLLWQTYRCVHVRHESKTSKASKYNIDLRCDYEERERNIFRISYFSLAWGMCQKIYVKMQSQVTPPRQVIINWSSVFSEYWLPCLVWYIRSSMPEKFRTTYESFHPRYREAKANTMRILGNCTFAEGGNFFLLQKNSNWTHWEVVFSVKSSWAGGVYQWKVLSRGSFYQEEVFIKVKSLSRGSLYEVFISG